jgi:hypothetical protein
MSLHRLATWDDVYFVEDNMREEDKDECRAGGYTPFDAISLSYENSIVSYTLLTPEGVPAAILGVSPSPLSPKFGLIWMLGTDDIRKHKFTFLRNCKPFLDTLYDELGMECLYNYTYAANSLHHSWIRWLGFTFLRQLDLPPTGQPFIEFVRLKG